MTDSPIAISTTNPWRSTKWPGSITKPESSISLGEIHSPITAIVQITYWAVPPITPPSNTSAAVDRLKGASPRIARVDVTPDDRANMPRCSSTTTRYASPKVAPLPVNASGIVSATRKKPAIPLSNINRRVRRSSDTALVSHTYPPYIQKMMPSIRHTW